MRKKCSVCGKSLEGHLVTYNGPRPVRCNYANQPACFEFTATEVLNLRASLGKATSDTMRMNLKKVLPNDA